MLYLLFVHRLSVLLLCHSGLFANLAATWFIAYMKVLSWLVGVFITLRSFFNEVSDIALKLVVVCSGVSLAPNKMPPIVKVIPMIIIKGSSCLTFEFLLSS